RAQTALLGCMAIVLTLVFVFKQDLEQLIAWTNGVFVIIYALSMLAAWRLLSLSSRPLIILGLVFCAFLAAALGCHLLYALGLFAVVFLVLLWQKNHLQRKAAAQ
ncbi:MAG: hypothetical protein ACRC7Q_08405, partial [Plesiomonas shigelloides]